MKKLISSIVSALSIFALSFSLTAVAKSAEFFTIGTGGPTGVYFQTGNAICKMLHKSAISAEHGRKGGAAKAYRCTAPSTGGSNYNIGQIKEGEIQRIDKMHSGAQDGQGQDATEGIVHAVKVWMKGEGHGVLVPALGFVEGKVAQNPLFEPDGGLVHLGSVLGQPSARAA